MKRIVLIIACITTIFLCRLAMGDVFTINSAPYFDGHSYVSPYNSTLNGVEVHSFCLEYEHHVGFNTPFDVTVVNLHNFTGALHDNFWQAGWLALQTVGLTDVSALSNIQAAIWLITTPGTTDPYLLTSGAFAWANQAALNYQSVSDSSFTLILRSGDAGQAQLICGQVPEPSTYAFCGIGLLALIGMRRFK